MPFRTPSKAIGDLLKLDPSTALFVIGGLAVITAGATAASYVELGGKDTLTYAGTTLIFGLVLTVMTQMRGLIARVLAWFLVAVFMFWGSAVTLQVVMGNILHPPVATSHCLINIFSQQCAAAKDAETAPITYTSSLSSVDSLQPPNDGLGNVIGKLTIDRGRQPASVQPDPRNEVIAHYWRPYTAENSVALHAHLSERGWTLPGAAAGIENTAVAEGFAEIRYFFKEDAALAARLAEDIATAPDVGRALGLRDMSATRWAERSRPGRLEVYLGL